MRAELWLVTRYGALSHDRKRCGARYSAFDIAKKRLNKSAWPIYKGTQNRNVIAAGDTILVYLGGHNRYSQSVIARARIKSVEDIGRRTPPAIDSGAAQRAPPFKVLHLEDVEEFKMPVYIRRLLGKLSFLPNTKNWGVSLVGGCRRISSEDFILIESACQL
jgi:hypothetical protein